MSNLPPNTEDLPLGETYKHYTAENSEGEKIVVGDGEYLQVSSFDAGIAATWTSVLTVQEFLKVIGQHHNLVTSAVSGDSYVSITDPEEGRVDAEGLADDVVRFITNEEPIVGYVRLDYDEISVCWGSSHARIEGSDAEYAEVGISVPLANTSDQLKALIQQTASATVRDNQQVLFSRIKQLQ